MKRCSFIICMCLLAVFAASVLAGCSKTESLADSSRKVTRQVFEREAVDMQATLARDRRYIVAELENWNERNAAHNKKLSLGRSDLDSQDDIKAGLINGIVPLAELAVTGGLTAAGGLGAVVNLAALFGLGMYARKQRGKVKRLEGDQPVGLTAAGRAAIGESG